MKGNIAFVGRVLRAVAARGRASLALLLQHYMDSMITLPVWVPLRHGRQCDRKTRAAVIKASGATRAVVSVFQAAAFTGQAQVQRLVESIVVQLTNAMVETAAETGEAMNRVRHDLVRAIGPALEKVGTVTKDQVGQVVQRAYWELIQAVRTLLLMHRP